MRLVTLLPSATEIVCILGLEKKLVGISHECDYPPSIAHLPKLTSSRINQHDKSREIHKSVNDMVKQALSVYDLNMDLLKDLRPDYLITQDLCDVCALPFSRALDACNRVLGANTKIISLKPKRLADIWNDVLRVGEELGAEETCQTFKTDVDRRIRHIKETIRLARRPRKQVLSIEWMAPVMIAGMWMPEMIEIVGGEYLLASPGKPAPIASKDDLGKLDPDVVIVKPCGFKLEQTIREVDTLTKTVPWTQWKAYRENSVYLVDGNAYFNRPGPRIINSLEILAYCTHPDLFSEFGEKYRQDMTSLKTHVEHS